MRRCWRPTRRPGGAAFDAFVREVVREMTVKAGQKCTAIRRIFVPADKADAVADALAAKLEEHQGRRSAPRRHPHGSAGDARASRRRRSTASAGSRARPRSCAAAPTRPTLDGIDASKIRLRGADPAQGRRMPRGAGAVHEVEVFGPAATIVPYRDEQDACRADRAGRRLAGRLDLRRGQGFPRADR